MRWVSGKSPLKTLKASRHANKRHTPKPTKRIKEYVSWYPGGFRTMFQPVHLPQFECQAICNRAWTLANGLHLFMSMFYLPAQVKHKLCKIHTCKRHVCLLHSFIKPLQSCLYKKMSYLRQPGIKKIGVSWTAKNFWRLKKNRLFKKIKAFQMFPWNPAAQLQFLLRGLKYDEDLFSLYQILLITTVDWNMMKIYIPLPNFTNHGSTFQPERFDNTPRGVAVSPLPLTIDRLPCFSLLAFWRLDFTSGPQALCLEGKKRSCRKWHLE